MTIPVYPADLPPPLRADYAFSHGEGRGVFRNDAGPASVSLRFAAVTDIIPFSTQLYRWQLERFKSFYLDTTVKGAKPFILPDPLRDGWPMLDENFQPLLDENDQILLITETMLVQFADQSLPTEKQLDVEAYRVDFRLWRLPA